MLAFFSPFVLVKDSKKVAKDVIVGKCMKCKSYVRGSFLATSNFKRHLVTYRLQEFINFENNLENTGKKYSTKN